MKQLRLMALLPLLVLLGGCGSGKNVSSAEPAPNDAEQFLRWSMNKYADMKSFKASIVWQMESPGKPLSSEKREFAYVSPNSFKVVTAVQNGGTMTTVSDGQKMIEFAEGLDSSARQSEVPPGIASARAELIRHPMFNGSLIYQFFGGSDNLDNLIQKDKGKVEFGSDEKAQTGEDSRTVMFYGAEGYGHVTAVIGKKTGLVHRIKYDFDGARQQMKAGQGGADDFPQINATEIFSSIQTNAELAAKTFDTTLPKGVVLQTTESGQPASPLPVGEPAPDMELTALDGKKLKLSTLKGKIVMIDFWATWCGPCVKSLPITNKMHELYASKGLQVLTVSNEDIAVVSKFIAENKYTFPAYLDTTNQAAQAYHVNGIPCLVIIDAHGNLSSYSVGSEPEERVIEHLKKAGLKI